MLKRCLLAVIVALLVTSSQIAAADVNWDSVPRIYSKAQLAQYLENERRRGQREFNFVLTYVIVNTQEELDAIFEKYNYFMVAPLIGNIRGERGTGRISFTIKEEYPGTKIANAYDEYLRTGENKKWLELNHEEKLLFREAVGIVDEANKLSSEKEKMRYIYAEINNRSTYYDEKEKYTGTEDNKHIKPFCTAIGTKINDKRGYNCQGYADAFYMLGRMCNLNIKRISGMARDENGWGAHSWNAITFNDGKSYCVDVGREGYFAVNRKHMEEAGYWCEWEIIPNLQ